MKSATGKQTLLNYVLIKCWEQEQKSLLDFEEEYTLFDDVQKVNIEEEQQAVNEVTARFTELKTAVVAQTKANDMDFVSKVKAFQEENLPKLDAAKKLLTDT